MIGLFFIGVPFSILVMYIILKALEHDCGATCAWQGTIVSVSIELPAAALSVCL